MTADQISDPTLFDAEPGPPVTLADRYGVPPFTVLDRRAGYWQERKRRWLSMGIQSELGRGDTFERSTRGPRAAASESFAPISVSDPMLCELVYRWYTRPGSTVLDPFAGGSVRGIVASVLGRQYTGVDIRAEQVDANEQQRHLCYGPPPTWLVGDATRLHQSIPTDTRYDLVFSCPPYADLERYSDDPRDVSTWTYDEWVEGHARAIWDACAMLHPNRYAAWVMGDIRGKTGALRGLQHETVAAFRRAGMLCLNEYILIDPTGSARVRSGIPFDTNRKATTTHQYLLVFVKGDVRAAADWVTEQPRHAKHNGMEHNGVQVHPTPTPTPPPPPTPVAGDSDGGLWEVQHG